MLVSNRKSNVIFTGRLEGDDLNLWYNIANCFILPSYQEPFGAVTNEALLAGCWCIISNKAGSRCLIQEGINGYTFTPTDVAELIQKMNSSVLELSQNNKDERNNRMIESYRKSIDKLINHIELLVNNF